MTETHELVGSESPRLAIARDVQGPLAGTVLVARRHRGIRPHVELHGADVPLEEVSKFSRRAIHRPMLGVRHVREVVCISMVCERRSADKLRRKSRDGPAQWGRCNDKAS